MKLLPVLAATLMQEAKAACTGSIFSVTCHDDLMIELQVNHECLAEKFPKVAVTELQLSPTNAVGTVPSNQCLPCTESSPQTSASGSAGYCAPSNKFFAFDYQADTPAPAAVDTASTNLWFKAGKCGTSMTVADNVATFATTIGKPAEIDGATSIVTEATILATDITCQYPAEISGIDLVNEGDLGRIVADASSDGDKIEQDDNPDDVSQDLFDLGTTNDGSEVTSSTVLTLGDEVTLTVTATDTAITDFYLSDCTASNGKSGDDLKELKLVTEGCMNNLGVLDADISATMSGKELSFKQFAFADSADPDLKLLFEVTCDIMLGEKPTNDDCAAKESSLNLKAIAGRKRREESSTYQESTEYNVQLGINDKLNHDGIVVAHVEEKTGTSGALTNTIALVAGTAVMLL